MKKTIITGLALLTLASVASAGSTRYAFDAEDVITTYVTDTATTNTLTHSGTSPLYSNTATNWVDTSVTFMLDLDKLSTLTYSGSSFDSWLTLVSINVSSISADDDSSCTLYLKMRTHNGTNKFVLGTGSSNFYTKSAVADTSGTYTMITEMNQNTTSLGVTYLFDSGSDALTAIHGSSGIGYNNQPYQVDSITVNADYVTAFAVSNATLNMAGNGAAGGIGAAATALEAKAAPEPATATLSLLALAGLAARRRRK